MNQVCLKVLRWDENLYSWAFKMGRELIKKLEEQYTAEGKIDEERLRKSFERVLLNLRSEALPEKFRRELINVIVEGGIEIGIHEEIKKEKPWRIDEFYRFSTQILAGLLDALHSWINERKSKQEAVEV